jgi:hypothetical protein
MKARRSVLWGGGSALLAVWLAAAANQEPPAATVVANPDHSNENSAETLARDIQSQAERLRARLASAPRPSGSGRNPFKFEMRSARRFEPPAAAAARDSAPEVLTIPEPMPLTLSGIAEDAGGEGAPPTRTAVLSGLGDVFLAKSGETILSRYEVVAVGADAVELKDLSTLRTFRLGLR